jgi:SAM-dependent methyltransferase
MAKWFRSAPPPHLTALAMVGARAGDQVVFLGAADASLAAEVAKVTGLNGRTVVVDQTEAGRARVDQAAAHAGALVDFVVAPMADVPFDADTFDLCVASGVAAWSNMERAHRLAEGFRVLRPGGRFVMIAGIKRQGIFGALPSRTAVASPEIMVAFLAGTGAVAARLLADVEGVAYYEARKPR